MPASCQTSCDLLKCTELTKHDDGESLLSLQS